MPDKDKPPDPHTHYYMMFWPAVSLEKGIERFRKKHRRKAKWVLMSFDAFQERFGIQQELTVQNIDGVKVYWWHGAAPVLRVGPVERKA